MEMEGINWDEVNAQANDIMKYFFNLKEDLYNKTNNFAFELSNYWASGNAAKFEGLLNQKLETIEHKVVDCENDTKNYLSSAVDIYSSTFNAGGKLYVQPIGASFDEIANVFKETVNGITGMNKDATNTCVENYKNSVNTIIDEFNANVSSIHLSIMDAAGVQSEAFSGILNRMKTEINQKIDEMISYIETAKAEEQDNLALAKQQTTSTFSE